MYLKNSTNTESGNIATYVNYGVGNIREVLISKFSKEALTSNKLTTKNLKFNFNFDTNSNRERMRILSRLYKIFCRNIKKSFPAEMSLWWGNRVSTTSSSIVIPIYSAYSMPPQDEVDVIPRHRLYSKKVRALSKYLERCITNFNNKYRMTGENMITVQVKGPRDRDMYWVNITIVITTSRVFRLTGLLMLHLKDIIKIMKTLARFSYEIKHDTQR